MTDLPSGWTIRTLGEVATWGSGGTPQAGNPRYYGGQIPWAVIGDLTDSDVFTTEKHITEQALADSSAKLVPEGAILIAMYGSIGKMGIAKVPMATNQAIAFALPNPETMDAKFLFWYLRSQRDVFLASGKGATQQNISQTLLKSWEIPVPPLQDQKRIVEALDDHLSRLDKALAEVEATMLKFETLERSSLEANFQGVLDSEQAESLPLSAVTDRVKSLDPKTLGVQEFKYVDIGSISADLETPRIETSTTTTEAPSRARQHLASGDVVFSTVRPYQKKIALINDDLDGEIASTGFCVLRPKSHALDSRYLFHYLKSDMLLNQVLPLQRGASYPAVGDSDVKQATIPLPDLETQRGIAATLDSVVGTIKSQKGQLQSIIEFAQTLRRSLLHKAFTGELLEEK